jgi:hypothetical protein
MAEAEDTDDEFEAEEPEDLDEEDLEALSEDEDLLEDDDAVVADEDEDVLDEDDADEEDAAATGAKKTKAKAKAKAADADDEDEEEEDEEILDADDVEASLDVILKDRLVVEEEEDEEEEEAPDPEERAEGATKVPPKRPDEFVCQSCFLVKHPSQLADSKKQLCRDCV